MVASPHRILLVCVLCAHAADLHPLMAQPAQSNIFGFSARSAVAERALEASFLRLPSAERAREAHAYLTAEPHVAGTPRDKILAEWVRDRWREYGLEGVEIVEHQVLLPYATDVAVELVSPRRAAATMKEDAVSGDPFSARDVGLAYHAYSASGDVTAPVVYANGGDPADYAWLADHGIDVRGKIVIVRYSMPYSYRGFKALAAEERGAAGILIYSDPAEDGDAKGKTYPDGPWGPVSHIQRGGIVYDFRVPGDPLTPGWASVDGAKRIDAADAISLPKIISAPLSSRDARPILEALAGTRAPAAWQGGLPIEYRVGDGSARARLRVRMDNGVRPIWTVIARLTGTVAPDELVIAGNHRDAWVYGGVDPSSGTASLMELARSLGALAKRGMRPARTIVFANWDAEEFTLTSSTEWGEQHASDLGEHAVAYLNVDSSTSGPEFKVAAAPALNRVAVESSRDVLGGAGISSETISNRLGSGSDYTVFLNFLGVPIADLSFTGPYGVYHSVYDNHLWMSKFGDPGFVRHAAMARVWGVMMLRLANADILPLDYRPAARRIREFVNEAVESAPGADRAVLTPLFEATARFEAAAQSAGGLVDRTLSRGAPTRAIAAGLDRRLIATERAFLDPAGLPNRPWYRHLIYAPKPTYAPEVVPGVTEALAGGDRLLVAREVDRLIAALDRASASLMLMTK